jgi:2-polyprenyl-3-methyl-5-hydroxy-6-metoxy-1,4-benzoquinol methylase
MVESLDLGEVPFYWRVKKREVQQPLDVPVCLPFSFSFIDDLQLVIQKRNPLVLQWLDRVYKEDANVGYLQEGHALADSYGGEFIEFFQRASALLREPPASAADIGCGGVYLLQKVRELGLTVKGIDPSPVTAAAGRKSGIEIVSDFYPSQSLTERFDVLFHYDVLEHVEDPVGFLQAHHANLSTHGALIFAVPDCSHHIALGDVSMLLHEHLNYFDLESLTNVLLSAGFEPLLLESAKHGGVLMCCAIPRLDSVQSHKVKTSCSKFLLFREKAMSALRKFEDIAREANNGELGLYVPLRALPYLSQIPLGLKLRFFDDNQGLHGCFYDGHNAKIESREDLFECPPTCLLICSLAFGEKILNEVRKVDNHNMKLIQWIELFDSNL